MVREFYPRSFGWRPPLWPLRCLLKETVPLLILDAERTSSQLAIGGAPTGEQNFDWCSDADVQPPKKKTKKKPHSHPSPVGCHGEAPRSGSGTVAHHTATIQRIYKTAIGASLFCGGITFSLIFFTLVFFFCKQSEHGCCYPTSKMLLKYVTKVQLF